jgi:inward rectifier potassium channel
MDTKSIPVGNAKQAPQRPRRNPWVITGARKSLLDDLYPSLLEASWLYLLLFITADFIAVNALFAAGYMLVGGVANARQGSFADMFFFSVQTMATIGYGQMAPASLGANVLMSLEALLGLVGLALVTGLIFAKFSRPTARVRFSQFAIVGLFDGAPCLMFRMANERKSQIVEATIHVVMIRRETTVEGETIWRNHDLEMRRHRNPFFALSWLAIHPITAQSPLYGLDARGVAEAVSRISVSLVGIDDTYAQTVHKRHDYGAGDIIWGARFVDTLRPLPDGTMVADFSRLDDYQLDPSILAKLEAAAPAGAEAPLGADSLRALAPVQPPKPV